ncbi:MAG: hypothetical protein AMJ93_16670 [Anaerolineae bacterium SM23_84]|nr:MAG: hypothetical protein AMJ93_16670 [Anaerolineae bacterium SM23_84]
MTHLHPPELDLTGASEPESVTPKQDTTDASKGMPPIQFGRRDICFLTRAPCTPDCAAYLPASYSCLLLLCLRDCTTHLLNIEEHLEKIHRDFPNELAGIRGALGSLALSISLLNIAGRAADRRVHESDT